VSSGAAIVKTLILDSWISLGGIIVFVLLHGLLTAFELSLIKLRFSHFNTRLLDELRATKRYASIIDAPDRASRAARLAILVTVIGYGWLAIPLCYAWLSGAGAGFALPETVAGALAFVVALAVLYLFGELLPRAIGLSYPVSVLRAAAPLIVLIRFFGNFVIGPMTRLSRSILRLFGLKEPKHLESLDLETQIELLEEEAPHVTGVAQKILRSALQMRGLVVSDVMLPRNQVQFFNTFDSVADNLKMARRTGHTRFPLCEGDLDRCIGLIHIKDLFRYPGDLRSLDLRRIRRDIIRFDSEEPLESALTKLLGSNMHMALVLDEFRGTEGVLTLERILEQLVGEIRDEFDSDEVDLIQTMRGEGEALVSGLTPIHEIEERFDVRIENDEVSTVGGLITAELGRIPEPGEEVEVEGLHIRVTQVDETRVIEAHIRTLPQKEDSED